MSVALTWDPGHQLEGPQNTERTQHPQIYIDIRLGKYRHRPYVFSKTVKKSIQMKEISVVYGSWKVNFNLKEGILQFTVFPFSFFNTISIKVWKVYCLGLNLVLISFSSKLVSIKIILCFVIATIPRKGTKHLIYVWQYRWKNEWKLLKSFRDLYGRWQTCL